MKILKDLPMYGYEDGKVWNVKRNKPLAAYRGLYVVLAVGHNKTTSVSVARVAYCAEHGIELTKVPSGTMFTIEDGVPKVIDHRYVAKKALATNLRHRKANLEYVDARIRYLQKVKGYMLGEVEAHEVFEEIRKAGDELVPILASRLGTCEDTARVFVEEVELKCLDRVINGTFISSPYAYISRYAAALKKPRNSRIGANQPL